MVLLGVADGDTDKDMEVLCDKIAKLRIFTDENDKMNLSLAQVTERGTETAVMVVSNFTLCGNCSHGNRPEFFGAAAAAGCDLFVTGDVKYHEAHHARELEISIMRYIGATKRYITMPFVFEGTIIGVLSGLIGYLIQFYIIQSFLHQYHPM